MTRWRWRIVVWLVGMGLTTGHAFAATHTIEIPAGNMDVSGACSHAAAAPLLTNGPKQVTVKCTDADADSIEFSVAPQGWDGGTVTVTLCALSLGNNNTEVFEMDFAGQAVPSGGSPAAHSTTGERPATITWGNTATREQCATTSPAITLNGSPAAGANVYIRGQVDATATTMNPLTDLRILKALFTYTESGTGGLTAKPDWPFTLKSASPQADGLVLWYPMAPTTDTDVEDLSGNNRDGVQVNGASWQTGMNGGSSLGFDGTNDYVSLPSAASVASMTAASVSFWYRPDATPGSNAALYYESTTTSGYTRFGLYHNANGDLLAVMRDSATGSSFTVTETAPFTPGVWSHIVLTVNATTDSMVLYRNGASRGTPNTTAKGAFTSGAPADTIGLGAFTSSGGETYINGRIDDFRIYNKALTQTDVDHLYNAATRYDLYQP